MGQEKLIGTAVFVVVVRSAVLVFPQNRAFQLKLYLNPLQLSGSAVIQTDLSKDHKRMKTFDTRTQFKSKTPFAARPQYDRRARLVPVHRQMRPSHSPYTLSTSCSTKNSSSFSDSRSSSCQCSSQSSSNEFRQFFSDRLRIDFQIYKLTFVLSNCRQSKMRIKVIKRKQKISYILIFVIMLVCLVILVFIIKNTSQAEDIIDYIKQSFYSPRLLTNEATRKPPQSFTGLCFCFFFLISFLSNG